MSKFEPDRFINFEKMDNNIKIVKDRYTMMAEFIGY